MIIWAAWLQGRRNAPPVVRGVLDLWERLNPGHELRVIEAAEAAGILEELGVHQERITPQVTTDLVRSHLLARHGGVWVDATLLPARPLDDWLTPELRQAGFFAFHSDGACLTLQNWFLYSDKENILMMKWLDFFSKYFSTCRRYPTWKRALWHRIPLQYLRYIDAERREDMTWFVDPERGRNCCEFYPYAVHNYCLSYLLQTDPEVAAVWRRVPPRHHYPAQILREQSKKPPWDVFLKCLPSLLAVSPVHKLAYYEPHLAKVVDATAMIVRPT